MSRSTRSLATIAVVGLMSFSFVTAGCGKSSSSTTTSANGQVQTTSAGKTHLPTVKFVLHAGLAFGAFHHWIYKPFKAGKFSGGLLHHKFATAKAALAGLFAYHELKLALKDAKASPILSKLVTPFTALAAKLSSLGSRLKGGHVDPAAIASANTDVASAASAAGHSGASITDQIPSASQLASG